MERLTQRGTEASRESQGQAANHVCGPSHEWPFQPIKPPNSVSGASTLTAASQELLSRSHLTKLLSNAWPTHITRKKNDYHWCYPLSLGAVCYAATCHEESMGPVRVSGWLAALGSDNHAGAFQAPWLPGIPELKPGRGRSFITLGRTSLLGAPAAGLPELLWWACFSANNFLRRKMREKCSFLFIFREFMY